MRRRLHEIVREVANLCQFPGAGRGHERIVGQGIVRTFAFHVHRVVLGFSLVGVAEGGGNEVVSQTLACVYLALGFHSVQGEIVQK